MFSSARRFTTSVPSRRGFTCDQECRYAKRLLPSFPPPSSALALGVATALPARLLPARVREVSLGLSACPALACLPSSPPPCPSAEPPCDQRSKSGCDQRSSRIAIDGQVGVGSTVKSGCDQRPSWGVINGQTGVQSTVKSAGCLVSTYALPVFAAHSCLHTSTEPRYAATPSERNKISHPSATAARKHTRTPMVQRVYST